LGWWKTVENNNKLEKEGNKEALIKKELYDKLDIISRFTSIPLYTLINGALEQYLESINNSPELALNDLFGTVNITDIFEIINKVK